uniref:Helitron helicase-like domain-containing protein n=1 Tax=Nicotiana tabacum TaxID=4097 RepID=A0A1S4BAU6_TOBAC
MRIQYLQIRIAANATLDQRVYNKPSIDQIAAIWVDGNNPNVPFDREIIVHEHSGNKHRVKHYYGCYDPLQYPLLFPNGEVGWHQGIHKYKSKRGASTSEVANVNQNVPTYTSANEVFHKEEQGVRHESKSCVSCREYYCYKFQIRKGEKTILLLCGRLLQQFVVDMYIKLETIRLEFFRLQQALLRREILQGIVDSIMAGEYRGDKVGQRVILPASFIGGPRDMRRRYMDAMALVQRFGKPDLFITMTCNPDWVEIQENLCEGQLAQDRPDLVTRVFRAKLQDLKDQIFKKKIFGPVAAHVFVVEFQKRGLPHIHLLIILEQGYKITLADQYDKFISAELPDEEEYPLLHDLVVKHMMHGPCGKHRPTNSCMKDDDGEKVVDEIQNFQDARWVSPPEALWRIYEFNLSEMQPPVINLQLHLPDRQTVCYWSKQNLQNVIAWEYATLTMLTEYFRTCSRDTEARQYLYKEFPEYYVWNSQGKIWTKRKTRSVIGRIATANPREGERYYLRLLLNHVRGPLSFKDLLTVNGRECETFKEAAKER